MSEFDFIVLLFTDAMDHAHDLLTDFFGKHGKVDERS